MHKFTVSSSSSSVTFTNIDQSYDDLIILMSLKNGNSGSWYDILMNLNGDTANFANYGLYGTGTVVSQLSETVNNIRIPTSSATNTYGVTRMRIFDYTSTSPKVVAFETVGEIAATSSYQGIHDGKYSGTSPITSFTLAGVNGSVTSVGSTIYLYGVTRGSLGNLSIG